MHKIHFRYWTYYTHVFFLLNFVLKGYNFLTRRGQVCRFFSLLFHLFLKDYFLIWRSVLPSASALQFCLVSPLCLAGFCHLLLYRKFFLCNCPSGFNEIALITGCLGFLSGFIILGHVLSLAFFLCCASSSLPFFSPPSFPQSWSSREPLPALRAVGREWVRGLRSAPSPPHKADCRASLAVPPQSWQWTGVDKAILPYQI